MSTLDGAPKIDPADAEGLAAVVEDAAAGGDWKAAAWLLEHHPRHRLRFGNQEQIKTAIEATLVRVCRGLDLAGLSLQEQRPVLLGMRAAGARVPDPLEGDADA